MDNEELSEIEIELISIAQSSTEVFESMFGITHTEDWKSYSEIEQIRFSDLVNVYYTAACIIREKFDADVWKGHANGTVPVVVKSVRKQREGDAPGKKPEVKTAQSLLAKRLAK